MIKLLHKRGSRLPNTLEALNLLSAITKNFCGPRSSIDVSIADLVNMRIDYHKLNAEYKDPFRMFINQIQRENVIIGSRDVLTMVCAFSSLKGLKVTVYFLFDTLRYIFDLFTDAFNGEKKCISKESIHILPLYAWHRNNRTSV